MARLALNLTAGITEFSSSGHRESHESRSERMALTSARAVRARVGKAPEGPNCCAEHCMFRLGPVGVRPPSYVVNQTTMVNQTILST